MALKQVRSLLRAMTLRRIRRTSQAAHTARHTRANVLWQYRRTRRKLREIEAAKDDDARKPMPKTLPISHNDAFWRVKLDLAEKREKQQKILRKLRGTLTGELSPDRIEYLVNKAKRVKRRWRKLAKRPAKK